MEITYTTAGPECIHRLCYADGVYFRDVRKELHMFYGKACAYHSFTLR